MSKLRRLLIVNWRDIKNPQAGGAELHLHEVAVRLEKKGIKCVLYAHHFKGALRSEFIDGVEVHRVGNSLLFNYAVLFLVRGWIKKHNPDVIIDDSNKVPFFLPWICGVPVVVRIHHLFGKIIFQETDLFRASYVYFLEKLGTFAWKKVPVVTVSESSLEELRCLGIKNVTVAKNGLDITKYSAGENVIEKGPVIACVGRIKAYKRLDVILRCAVELRNKIPGLKIIIAGSGDGAQKLKNTAAELGIAEIVEFTGYVSDTRKVRIYSQAAVCVNPSLKEGWGLTVIEANACGTVVVASDVPGLRDSVKDGETGFLVPPGDDALFTEKIQLLLTNPQKRIQMEQAALAWSKTHSWDKTSDITLGVLNKALET